MYSKTQKALKRVNDIFKSDIKISANEVEIEREEKEKPKMSKEELEEYLKAYIRNNYGEYYPRVRGASPQGGYPTKEYTNVTDNRVQMIYDNIILKQQYVESIESQIIVSAIKAVENFSPAYVRRVLVQLNKKVD